jgi:hypothetical protein
MVIPKPRLRREFGRLAHRCRPQRIGAIPAVERQISRSNVPSSTVKTSKHRAERERCGVGRLVRSSHRAYLMSASMVSRAVGIFTSVM